jgi:hypothetical protein
VDAGRNALEATWDDQGCKYNRADGHPLIGQSLGQGGCLCSPLRCPVIRMTGMLWKVRQSHPTQELQAE